PRHLPSFPTRRSSDLALPGRSNWLDDPQISYLRLLGRLKTGITAERASAVLTPIAHQMDLARRSDVPEWIRKRIESSQVKLTSRSEEHTSELQSRFDL